MSQQADTRIHATLSHLRSLKGRARSVSFRPKQPSTSILNGQHASKIKGRGLNFEELRHYVAGDDVRTIDWKVTARTGAPYVRVYTEERDRAVLLLVDQRMSMFFGSVLNMKSVTAAEAAAISAFRVREKGDRVGGIIFGDEEMEELKPQATIKGLNHFLDRLSAANGRLHAKAPTVHPMPLSRPLRAAARIVKSGAMVIVFSDFDGWDAATEKPLRQIAQRNDLILVSVLDPTSKHLPDNMDVVMSDGSMQAQINTSDPTLRRNLADFTTGRLAALFDFSARYQVPVVPLTTAEETLPQLIRLLGGVRR